jgi:CRISPR-associated endonuclease Csn1
VVSFKQNLRVLNRTVNNYQHWQKDANGQLKKGVATQKGTNWAIRKSMHKDTVAGIVLLKKKKTVSFSAAIDVAIADIHLIVDKPLKQLIKNLIDKGLTKKTIVKHFKDNNNQFNGVDITKVSVYYFDDAQAASRVVVNEKFNSETICSSVTDTGIQKVLLNHLAKYNTLENGKINEHPELAFSPDGIDEMNKNIVELNDGKKHAPIVKVRKYEPVGNKFVVGTVGNKSSKLVEAAKGTNLFFAIYLNEETGKRSYETIPFYKVVEIEKQNAELIKCGAKRSELAPVPSVNANGDRLLFFLSPNDLVYVPNDEDQEMPQNISRFDRSYHNIGSVYKMVSASGSQCFFIRNDISSSIVNKIEFSALNKMERTIEGIMIKEVCWKLNVDRLGNIYNYTVC